MADPKPPTLTVAKRRKFLALVAKDQTVGNVAALRAAGVTGTRGQLRALVTDELAEEAREARGFGNEAIRAEIRRRAIDGVEEPVFHQGHVVGHIRRYSDRLLGMMAKAYVPEYRDTSDVSVTVAGQVGVEIEDRSASLDDVARVLEAVGALAQIGRGSSRIALPAAPDILAEPRDG